MVEWQQRLAVMCCHSIGMKHPAVASWLLIDSRARKQPGSKSFVIAKPNNQPKQGTLQDVSGQARSGQARAGLCFFAALSIRYYCYSVPFEFLRPSGAVAIAFAACRLWAGWQMTLFLTAHRRDLRLAAPLTAILARARWAALREGRRRHHRNKCCLVGLVVV